jgi:hypothetical protein
VAILSLSWRPCVCLRLLNVPSGDDDLKILIACTTFTGHLNPML